MNADRVALARDIAFEEGPKVGIDGVHIFGIGASFSALERCHRNTASSGVMFNRNWDAPISFDGCSSRESLAVGSGGDS